jgi:choline-glycine betaine transporter
MADAILTLAAFAYLNGLSIGSTTIGVEKGHALLSQFIFSNPTLTMYLALFFSSTWVVLEYATNQLSSKMQRVFQVAFMLGIFIQMEVVWWNIYEVTRLITFA